MKLKINFFFCMAVCSSFIYSASEWILTDHDGSVDSDDSFEELYLNPLNDLEKGGVDSTSDGALKSIRALLARTFLDAQYVDNMNDYADTLISFIKRMRLVPYNLSMAPDVTRATEEEKKRFFRVSLKLERAHFGETSGAVKIMDELLKPISRDYLIFCAIRSLGKIGARFSAKEGAKIASFLCDFILENVDGLTYKMPTFVWAVLVEALNRMGAKIRFGEKILNLAEAGKDTDPYFSEEVARYYRMIKHKFICMLAKTVHITQAPVAPKQELKRTREKSQARDLDSLSKALSHRFFAEKRARAADDETLLISVDD